MSESSDALARRWDAATCANARPHERGVVEALGSVLRPAATEPMVAALERRLGVGLPLSYRTFLLDSDGAYAQPAAGIMDSAAVLGLLDCASVQWLRDVDRVSHDIWGFPLARGDADPFATRVAEMHYLDHAGGKWASEDVKGGHIRYALQVGAYDDSSVFLLNPLVVDQEGEWEVWHFDPKYPGARRWRSFAALLEYDIGQREQTPAIIAERIVSAAETEPIAHNPSRPPAERLRAAGRLLTAGERERALPVLIELAGPDIELDVRQGALRCLAPHAAAPPVLAVLLTAAREADAPDRVLSSVLAALATSQDPSARAAAHDILTRPGLPDFVMSSAGRGAGDALWRAWESAREPRLIVELAYAADRRACGPLAELIVDPGVEQAVRERLSCYAGWPGDPSVVPALMTAAERGLASPDKLAAALSQLGAQDAALAVRVRAVRDGDRTGRAAQALGWMRHPDAPAALLYLFGEQPCPEIARGLGWSSSDAAAAALAGAADDPQLHQAAIDALETMGTPAALDHLAERCARDDTCAARALARRRDPRAREHLLGLLSDPDTALDGAEGLRDLGHPDTAAALLELVDSNPTDLSVTAAHALVSMRAAEAEIALRRLLSSQDAALRRLATSWKAD